MKKIMFNDKYGLTDAVLGDKKTMTRRIVTYPSKFRGINVTGINVCKSPSGAVAGVVIHDKDKRVIGNILPKYGVGEIVAIAENYMTLCLSSDCPKDFFVDTTTINRKYCGAGFDNKMFVKADLMPHHIRITDIRVERLQDISEEDFLKEGGLVHSAFDGINRFKTPNLGEREYLTSTDYKYCFQFMIDKICGKVTWDMNPYVWVYEFEKLD